MHTQVMVAGLVILMARVAWLLIMEDVTGRRRFLGAVRRVAPLWPVLVALLPRVASAAASGCPDNSGVPGDPGAMISGLETMLLNDAGQIVTALGIGGILYGSGHVSVGGHRGGWKSMLSGIIGAGAGIWAWSGHAMAMVHHYAGCSS